MAFALREPSGVRVRALVVGPGPGGDGRLRALGHPALLLDGVVLRTVSLGQRTGALLHGRGDVLAAGAPEPGPFVVTYRTLRTASLALLDPSTLVAVATVPELEERLARAVEAQAAQITLQMISTQLGSIEERLGLLLPQLAERWGAVTPDGVVLPAFFSHTVLAALIGVRRPSLTTALASLREPGLVRLPDRRWLLAPGVAGLSP